jgi:peptide/nickel transport system substrate-binding protein
LTEKVIFLFLTLLLIGSSLSLLYQVNKNFLVTVPDYGGSFSEGVIGSPRFINPLLSASEIDKDLVSLVYSGLLRLDSEGNLTPDLAESYELSEDGLNYTFVL